MNTLNQQGDILFVSRSGERRYRRPVEIVCAYALDDVRSALDRVEAAVAGGLHAAGLIAYEAAPAFDAALTCHAPRASGEGVPLLWFGLYETVERRPPLLAYAAGRDAGAPSADTGAFEVGDWTPRVTEAEYRTAVENIRERIAAGHTYQVNYSFPMRAAFHGDTQAWFRRLCAAQGADHCAYVNLGRFQVLSASPERFFRLDGHQLETRPMKGTRPRGLWSRRDRELAEELAASVKDRAENVMIVDLLRNDMGRVSETGSVRVRRLFEVERYETVWQMTSTITSWTAAPVSEILAALFPSGSVTGAPKVRTMAIIRGIEPFPRGVYCGTVGWWAPDRRAEFNVAIRTVTVDAETGSAEYPVGSGVTWGSTPCGEYEECRMKAQVLTYRRPEFELLESILFYAAGRDAGAPSDGAYFLLPLHLERLAASAGYFGFALDLDAIHAALRDEAPKLAAREPGPWKVRLMSGRTGAFRIAAEPAKPAVPVRIGFARDPVDTGDVFLYHKTTHREVYERARASRPDCDEVALWNPRGEITETATANIVLEIDGALLTPPVECGLLGGTMREHLLDTGVLREAVLTKADVGRAQTIRLVNSVRKWVDATFLL